jgi:hypothetical protein
LKFFLTLIIVLVSNTIFADNLTFRINHHGNIVNHDDLNRNEVFFQEVEFDEELEFSSELLKQHIRNISEVLPINTYVVLYGNKDGVVNKLDRTYSLKEISLSHTGEDHYHDPEIFFGNTLDIDIPFDSNQESIFILQKRKTALQPLTKLIIN